MKSWRWETTAKRLNRTRAGARELGKGQSADNRKSGTSEQSLNADQQISSDRSGRHGGAIRRGRDRLSAHRDAG
jgi:hypothetical protein